MLYFLLVLSIFVHKLRKEQISLVTRGICYHGRMEGNTVYYLYTHVHKIWLEPSQVKTNCPVCSQ